MALSKQDENRTNDWSLVLCSVLRLCCVFHLSQFWHLCSESSPGSLLRLLRKSSCCWSTLRYFYIYARAHTHTHTHTHTVKGLFSQWLRLFRERVISFHFTNHSHLFCLCPIVRCMNAAWPRQYLHLFIGLCLFSQAPYLPVNHSLLLWVYLIVFLVLSTNLSFYSAAFQLNETTNCSLHRRISLVSLVSCVSL